MVEPKQSAAQRKKEFFDNYATLCSCGEDNVYFVCKNDGCPDASQKLFCQECFYKGKHAHPPMISIPDYFSDVQKTLAALQVRLDELVVLEQAQQNVPYKALIAFLDSISGKIKPAAGQLSQPLVDRLVALDQAADNCL